MFSRVADMRSFVDMAAKWSLSQLESVGAQHAVPAISTWQ